jgi:phosphatidylglycerophosphatase A
MSAAAPEVSRQHTRWAWIVGTFFGIGHLRPGPGTWASGATILIWYFVGHQLPQQFLIPLELAIVAAVTAIGIPAGTVVAGESGREDPGFVVIDEVAGQMLTIVAAPLQWKYLIVGLILFRVFDILKPPPVRRLEHFTGGTGIMLDDLGAGLYAWIAFQALFHFGVLR